MARKKKDKILFEEEVDVKEPQIKTKTLFDHINAITQIQDKKYFDKLTDADKKTWSNYMINRFLSMNEDWVEIIADLDKYTVGNQLDPKIMYALYIDIFPKQKVYLKYIKPNIKVPYKKELISAVREHFQVSSKEAIEHLNIFYLSEEKRNQLKRIIIMYSKTEKEALEMMKLQ